MYLYESWYVGDRLILDMREEENTEYFDYLNELDDWNFGINPDNLDYVAPDIVEENTVIWNDKYKRSPNQPDY
ncbi:hypothetical protein [Geminocystis sp. NIES-3709]|uniref:hypothetical protein n=1 Tax=Geminocystis sp. NIES-3709 TaxID=1617448 RepID=UPI0005FC7E0A|nr:hypothetical protein [Geminocystis sp. NIES-3709]BAQ63946.1 hypothetical protein GM3709_711 [Geminocystis sp. NIES-3709]